MKKYLCGSVTAEKSHTDFSVKTDEKELKNDHRETIIVASRLGCKDIWNEGTS